MTDPGEPCTLPPSTHPDPRLSTAQLGEFILLLPVLVFSLVAHEYAHGAAALRQGDDTAYSLGRLTLNPLPHIDPWLSILLPAMLYFLPILMGGSSGFLFGGAKPIPVNPRKYRNFKRGDIIVSGAGIVTNLGLSLVFTLLFAACGLLAGALPDLADPIGTAQRMCTWGILLNLTLAFFNLIPVPPLDGSHLFYYLLPPAWGLKYRSLQRFGFLPIMALLFLAPSVIYFLMKPAFYALALLVGLVQPYAVGDAWNIFQR